MADFSLFFRAKLCEVPCARSEFWGVASPVPWGWRDSYRKMGNFSRLGDKSMFKMYNKDGLGREGDI